MSQLCGKDEPSVMNEAMLHQAVEEQGPQKEAGHIAMEEGIEFNDVFHLCLEYRNILKIEHLWQFTSLTKLQLNNNLITKIEGLDCLTNLTWLDLSFNSIEKIEGLESLTKLEDLNLFNNSILVIENMDTLGNLSFLSIANNLLHQLHNVIYLRRFKKLHTVNLSGNPISKEGNYKLFIIAYLPDLVYLDYKLTTNEQTREQASAKYQYAIEETRHNELQAQDAIEIKQRQEDELQIHLDAFVEFLNNAYLFDSMFAEDPEAEKLAILPGMRELVDQFKLQLVGLCIQIFELGLAEQKLRRAEIKCFIDGLKEGVADNRRRAAHTVAEFEQHKKKMIRELQQISDTAPQDTQFQAYREDIQKLFNDLMMLELQLVDQLEDIIKDFERNITDMVGSFIEKAQGIFSNCRDLENYHHEKVKDIAILTLERVAKNEMDEDMPDDLRMLFVDNDTAMDVVGASHCAHILKIDNREDKMVMRANAWMGSFIKGLQDEEVKRNRKRISEIQIYIDHLRNQLDEFLQDDQ